MSDFTLDGVEPGTDFDELPTGSYVCVIDDCEPGTASTGTPNLRVQFKVVMGEHKGRVISDWLYFTQAAAGVVRSKIDAAGVTPPAGLKGGDAYATVLSELLHGEHVEIVVRADTYNGETRNKVKAWKKPPKELSLASAVTKTAVGNDEDIPF